MADSEYIYEIIDNEKDALYCAQLIAEEFSAHNPITRFRQITSACFFNESSWPLMNGMFPEHLSFLARYRATGEIIGAIIVGDLYLQHHKKQLCDISNLSYINPTVDLFKELDNLFISHDFGQELKLNMVLHITKGAVRAQHSGKGVASQMRKIVCDYARDKKDFEYALVQVTNEATRHIYLNKMNGKEMTTIDPRTWIWKKKGEELLYPYKDYKGGSIPNILIKL